MITLSAFRWVPPSRRASCATFASAGARGSRHPVSRTADWTGGPGKRRVSRPATVLARFPPSRPAISSYSSSGAIVIHIAEGPMR